MNYTLRRSRAIKYLIIILALLIGISVWPLGIIRHDKTIKSDEEMTRDSGPLNTENELQQLFTSFGTYLESVEIYVTNDMAGKRFSVNIFNTSNEEVCHEIVQVEEHWEGPAYIKASCRHELEYNRDYILILEGLNQDLYVGLEDHYLTSSPANSIMTIGGEEKNDVNLMVKYNYRDRFELKQIIIIYILLIAVVIAAVLYAEKLFSNGLNDRDITVKAALQIVLNPVLGLMACLSVYLVIFKKIFSFDTKNNIFLTIGLLMLYALIALVINCKRNTETVSLPTAYSIPELIKDNIGRWLQIISVAVTLWYCYEYMNGLYDISHAYAARRILIAILFVIITTFNKKELFNIPNMIWIVLGPVLGYMYASPYKGIQEQDVLYKLNAWVIVAGVFVIINMIYSLVRAIQNKALPIKLNLKFVIPFAVFGIGICLLSNTRQWPGFLILICTLLGYRLVFWEDREKFVEIVCRGIILNFYMMVYFSLMHRPYYFYIWYRYNLGFHTVTVTAYYLTLVLLAAIIHLYIKYKEKGELREVIPQFITVGIAGSYLIMTLSRTGLVSTAIAAFIGMIVIAVFDIERRQKIKFCAKSIGLLIAVVIYMFPVTFTATRICPSLADDPVVFDFEKLSFTMYKGTAINCSQYMTVERFGEVFLLKLFNIEKNLAHRIDASIHMLDMDPILVAGKDLVLPEIEILSEIEEPEPIIIEELVDDDENIAEEQSEDTSDEEENDISNGRMDIFKAYIAQINMWGHDEMTVEAENGEILVHAHNSFLQVIHDHGLIFGIYFILFAVYVYVLALLDFRKHKYDVYRVLLFVLMTGFAAASMVEWIFHPCNPFTMAVFMAMMPLVIEKEPE